MNIFYAPGAVSGTVVTLDENESAHCVRVLRLGEGDGVTVMNGSGGLFEGNILDAHPKRCTVNITRGTESPRPAPHLHIAIAPTKAIDRLEWFLEKCIEIGVGEVTPLLCQKSERRQVNDERLEKLVVSAMKQSMQLHKTRVNPLTKYTDLVKDNCLEQKFICHCDEGHKPLLKDACKPGKDTLVLIGPEGDFGREEIANAVSSGFVPVSLGNSRLRTETAGLVACMTMNLINQ